MIVDIINEFSQVYKLFFFIDKIFAHYDFLKILPCHDSLPKSILIMLFCSLVVAFQIYLIDTYKKHVSFKDQTSN